MGKSFHRRKKKRKKNQAKKEALRQRERLNATSMKGEQRMLNIIILIGRLTKDPELRYTPNGKPVTTFTLAVDRLFRNQQGERDVDFINIVVWGTQAEHCANYLKKGKLAAVSGRLQIRPYDGQDGKKHWATEVIASDVRFLSPKDNSANENQIDDDIPF